MQLFLKMIITISSISNDDGEKLNNDTFEEAYNFVNGLARVKYHDNDWAIIRHAQVIVDNCDYINEFDPVEDNLKLQG